MKPKHYFLHELSQKSPALFASVRCDPDRVFGMLRTVPNEELSLLDRLVAIVTTLFKRAGISGWTKTGCDAVARGAAVRDAQHSTDGFYTIDLKLTGLTIGGLAAPPNRFLRVEVEPKTRAHEVCEESSIAAGTVIEVGGEVVIDNDPPPFPEIHPIDRLRIV
jgi:hypothetical protein